MMPNMCTLLFQKGEKIFHDPKQKKIMSSMT